LAHGHRGSGISVDPERVRRARIERGLSLAQLAGAEVSKAFIHQIEQGRSRPSRAILELIAKRTGRPLSFFTAGLRAPAAEADLAVEVSRVAARLKAFASSASLTQPEHEALQMVETLLRGAEKLLRSISIEMREAKA
jgi:transcriptional regulator with XRE-family HTH domain